MFKVISTIIILSVLSLIVQAQTEKSLVAAKWERYKVSDYKVSILLPKMPILIESFDVCNQTASQTYAAYNEEVVYQLGIYTKSSSQFSEFCKVKNNFGRKIFENKIAQFNADGGEESKFKLKDRDVTKFSSKLTTYLFIDDLTNNRFFVLAFTHRSTVKPKTEQFVQSIDFKKKPDGIEIKKGSPKTIGDELYKQIETQEKTDEKNVDGKTEGLVIVVKPRADYTDAARQAQIQGTVTLRVTFLANGGIGSITPVSGLPYGITEQAIIAASKIVFLPQKVNGETKNVTKQVQYSFTIY